MDGVVKSDCCFLQPFQIPSGNYPLLARSVAASGLSIHLVLRIIYAAYAGTA